MSAKAWNGIPQPGGRSNFIMRYKKVVYSGVCTRCGMYDNLADSFRFGKSGRKSLAGFCNAQWAEYDIFFVRPEIAEEITKARITGVSFRPALDHRSGSELPDRVQMVFTNIIPCAEISRLPTVTCRPNNEEVLAIRAISDKHKGPEGERKSLLPPELLEKMRKQREQIAKLPYCGRVKYSVPSSLVVIPDKVKDAPDLFETAEWFGAGAQAFHLILASERFVNLVRQRRWKGLVFNRASQTGLSERRDFGLGAPQ